MAAASGLEYESLAGVGAPARRLRCTRTALRWSSLALVAALSALVLPLAVRRLQKRVIVGEDGSVDGLTGKSESFLMSGEERCAQASSEKECDAIGCCSFDKGSSTCTSDVGSSPCRQGSLVSVGTRWVLSSQGESCTDACEKKHLTCDQEALAQTDTEEKVMSAAWMAGHQCKSDIGSTAGWAYEENPGVCTDPSCCGDGSCKGICTYGNNGAGGSCDAAASAYSRLCPCAKPGAHWLLGEQGLSCTAACKKEGAECDEDALGEVDTADEVQGVARSAGATCGSKIGEVVGWAYDSNPSVCTSATCCGDGSCKGVCAYGKTGQESCGAPGGDYSRFCPCVGGKPGGSKPKPPTKPTSAPGGKIERISTPSWHWGSGVRGMQTDAGFSWYTRVFSLLREEEPMEWQMGTAGTWMTPTNIDFDVCACDPKGWPSNIKGDPSYGCCESSSKCSWLYSTIEGGPGYWSGGELPTKFMKWRIVVTTACYENGGQTPLFFYGGKVGPCGELGVIQVSNRMLLAPDGIAFSREGLFGVSFVRTPVGKTSDDDDRNFWTFVVDAENFAGPVAYLLPEMFGERPKKWARQSAHLKDFGLPGVGISNGGGFGFEWNTLFTYKQDDFFKIPQMAVPMSGGKSTFAMNGRGYADDDVYHPLERALGGGRPLKDADIMAGGESFDCNTGEHDATYRLSEDKTVKLGRLKTEKSAAGCTWSMTPENSSGYFPQYFRGSDLHPVHESGVPEGLRAQKFPKKGSIWPFKGPYDATSTKPQGGCLDSPGPADPKLYCAQTSSPSWIAYRWYRFVDQPGLQRLQLSGSEKDFLQSRVEKLHRMLTGKDRWIKAGAAKDSGIAEISAAQLVTPPAHLAHGYVPIVVYEGLEKPSGC